MKSFVRNQERNRKKELMYKNKDSGNCGANSQNLLRQINKIFVTLRCFYVVITYRK